MKTFVKFMFLYTLNQVEPVLIYGEKRLAAPGIETEFHLEDRRFVEQQVC